LVLSLVAGAATHVAWDEFTHIDRFGYRHLSWLAQVHGPLAGYRWAQYGSGVVGALLIAVAVRNWWRSAAVVDPQPRSPISPSARVAVLASVSLATIGGALAGGASAALGDEGVRRALFLIATWGGGAGLVTLLACAVFLRTTVTAEP
jgi:hypothetical protein